MDMTWFDGENDISFEIDSIDDQAVILRTECGFCTKVWLDDSEDLDEVRWYNDPV